MTPDQLGVDFSWFPRWVENLLAAQVIMQHVPVQKVVEKQVLVLFSGVLFLGSSDWCWVLTSQTLWLLLSFQNRWLRLHNDLFISIGILVKYNSFVALNMNVHRKRHPLDMYPIHSVGMHLLYNSTWMMLLRSFCHMDPLLDMWGWNPAGVWHPWTQGTSPMGFSTPNSWDSWIIRPVTGPYSTGPVCGRVRWCACGPSQAACFFFFQLWTGVDLKIADRHTGLRQCPNIFWWTIEPSLLWVSADRDVSSQLYDHLKSPLLLGKKAVTRRVGMPAPVRGPKEFCSFK